MGTNSFLEGGRDRSTEVMTKADAVPKPPAPDQA
jgi:hypothetical protein